MPTEEDRDPRLAIRDVVFVDADGLTELGVIEWNTGDDRRYFGRNRADADRLRSALEEIDSLGDFDVRIIEGRAEGLGEILAVGLDESSRFAWNVLASVIAGALVAEAERRRDDDGD